MTLISNNRLRARNASLVVLSFTSCSLAAMSFPDEMWWWFILFGVHGFGSLFLRVGWVVPSTMGGTYFGFFFLHSPITSGSIEAQTYDWLTGLLAGTGGGFVVGVVADLYYPISQRRNRLLDTPECDEQSHAAEWR